MLSSFLDDIERIATRGYEPSDQDVVRARLRTLGVQEHKLVMERSGTPSRAALCCRTHRVTQGCRL